MELQGVGKERVEKETVGKERAEKEKAENENADKEMEEEMADKERTEKNKAHRETLVHKNLRPEKESTVEDTETLLRELSEVEKIDICAPDWNKKRKYMGMKRANTRSRNNGNQFS